MRIRVVGAYLPQLDPVGMEKFIADDADSFRRTLRELRDHGVVEATDVDIEVRARQLPAEVKAGLETCALSSSRSPAMPAHSMRAISRIRILVSVHGSRHSCRLTVRAFSLRAGRRQAN